MSAPFLRRLLLPIRVCQHLLRRRAAAFRLRSSRRYQRLRYCCHAADMPRRRFTAMAHTYHTPAHRRYASHMPLFSLLMLTALMLIS